MRNFIRSLVLLLALGSSVAAQAALINISQAPRDITSELNLYSSAELPRQIELGNAALPGAANNYFADRYDFTLDGFYMAGGFLLSELATADFGLQFTGLKLYGAGGLLLAGMPDLEDTLSQVWSLSPITLGPGDYYLEVSGHANALQSAYNGVFGVIQAVPEPGTMVIMLTGLGLICLLGRRRRPLR